MQHILNAMKQESHDSLPDISHFVSDGLPPLGSNPGGVHIDPFTHQKHYVKFYDNPDQARSEVAASKIYEKLGAATVKPQLAKFNNKLAVVSKWRNDITPLKGSDYLNLTDEQKHDLSKHFHAAVLTKNWDTVGTGFDNLGQDVHGRLHTIDTGGTFNFRAQGGHKDYGHDIDEHKSLRDPSMNHYSAHAFAVLKPEHLRSGAEAAKQLTSADIHDAINSAGLTHDHATALIGRRNNIVKENLNEKY